jgi:predicted hydrocarbon binding protein
MLAGSPEIPSHLPEVIGFEVQDARSYECLVTGKSEAGAFLRLLTLLESSGLKVQTSSFEAREGIGTFSATILVQGSKSDAEMFALVEKIMRSRMVTSIEFSPRNKRIFSNFRFPVNIVRNERVVLIRADTILDLETNFRKVLGEKSDLLFFDAGRSYGENLTRVSPKRSEFENDVEYLEGIFDVTKATGWGVSSYQQLEGAELLFLLSEPPPGIPINFMTGMIIGIAEAVFDRKMRVVSTGFDKSKNLFSLRAAQITL